MIGEGGGKAREWEGDGGGECFADYCFWARKGRGWVLLLVAYISIYSTCMEYM